MGRPYIVHFMRQWESSHSSGFGPRVFPLTLFERSISHILQGLQLPRNLNRSKAERLQSAGEYWNILHSTYTQIHNKHNMCMNTSTIHTTNTCTHAHTCTCALANKHTCMCVCAHTYTHTHTHTHTLVKPIINTCVAKLVKIRVLGASWRTEK